MGSPHIPDPVPPPAPPKKPSPASLSALEKQRRLRLKKQGMAGTFVTGQLGLQSPPPIAPKNLLGG